MKKVFVLFAVLLAALFVVGCASKPPAGPSAAQLMADAKGGAPDGTLVGQATASGTKDAPGVSQAQKKAVEQVKRGLKSIAGQLVDAQVTSGGVSGDVSSQFKQSVNKALDTVSVAAQKVDSGNAADFTGWAIYSLTKDEALKSLTAAVNAAKNDVAGTGNFNVRTGFDAAFDAAAAKEWK